MVLRLHPSGVSTRTTDQSRPARTRPTPPPYKQPPICTALQTCTNSLPFVQSGPDRQDCTNLSLSVQTDRTRAGPEQGLTASHRTRVDRMFTMMINIASPITTTGYKPILMA